MIGVVDELPVLDPGQTPRERADASRNRQRILVPAAERLHAFGDGYLDLLERHADVLAAAIPTARGPQGPDQLYATHLMILLREAAPHLDAEYAARAMLAML